MANSRKRTSSSTGLNCKKTVLKITSIAVAVLGLHLLHKANAQDQAYDINTLSDRSESILGPSPTSAAFSKYITNPVGYYTGTPQVSIPLWNLKLKDFTLPVKLSYHAGGVKVEESASNVGLSWVLNAGGVITRAVKDIPDDQTVQGCTDTYLLVQPSAERPPVVAPSVSDFSYCGYGLLWALDAPASAHFDGLDSYDIDLTGFNASASQPGYSLNLLKKFFGVTQNPAPTPGSPDYRDLYLLPVADKEPDMFFFNFAGRTGKFVFDVSGASPQIRVFPYQDLLIQHVLTDNKITGFQVTDENGIRFTFNEIETTRHYVRGNTYSPITDALTPDHEVKSYYSPHSIKEYTSAWYLSRIETPLGDYLDFGYETEKYRVDMRGPQQTDLYYVNLNPAKTLVYDPNIVNEDDFQGMEGGYHNSLVVNYSEIETVRPSFIENNDIRIDFHGGLERSDLIKLGGEPDHHPKAIDEIIVQNKIGGNNRLKRYALGYDYFTSYTNEDINPGGDFIVNVTPGPGSTPTYVNALDINTGDSTVYYKRLRLRSLQEYGKTDTPLKPPYEFEYKDKDFTGTSWHSLPHRLSFEQDFWGYFNAAAANKTLIPSIWIYPSHFPLKDNRQFSIDKRLNHTGPEYHLPGANRHTNLNTVDVGMLTKINYPTGGFTQYEYGSHIFNLEGEEIVGGGVRINKVIKHAGKEESVDYENDIIYNFHYNNSETDNTTSGEIISLPIFADRNTHSSLYLADNDDSELAYNVWTIRYSVPQLPLGQTNGSYVGYRTVTEYIQGNGRVVRKYSMPATWNVENDKPSSQAGGQCEAETDGHCDDLYRTTEVVDIFLSVDGSNTHLSPSDYDFSQNPALPNTFPYPDNPNYDWQRGHLLSEQYYTEPGFLLKENKYHYTNYFPYGQTEPAKVFGYKIAHHYPTLTNTDQPYAYVFRASKYPIYTHVIKVPQTKTEILYDEADQTKFLVTETTYAYNNQNLPLASEETVQDSNDRVIKNTYTYPTDYAGSEFGSNLLRDKHIHSTLLKHAVFRADDPVSKTEVSFESIHEHLLPSQVWTYPNGETDPIHILYNYDDKGNVTQQVKVVEAAGSASTYGMYTSYIWGYLGEYPVVKVENASYNDVVSELTSIELETLNGAPSDSDIASAWNKLSSAMPGAQVYSFTYDPHFGITSETAPDGTITLYEYDELGRLEVVRDHLGNIVKKLSYQYNLD